MGVCRTVEQPPMSVDDFDHSSRVHSTSTSSLLASRSLLRHRFGIFLHRVHSFSVQGLQHAEQLRFRYFRPVGLSLENRRQGCGVYVWCICGQYREETATVEDVEMLILVCSTNDKCV
jgi:hypothetical protein